MKTIRKIFHDCLTEDNQKYYCFSRVMSFLAFIVFCLYTGWELYHTGNIHLVDFSQGLLELSCGAGVAIAAKQLSSKSYTEKPTISDDA